MDSSRRVLWERARQCVELFPWGVHYFMAGRYKLSDKSVRRRCVEITVTTLIEIDHDAHGGRVVLQRFERAFTTDAALLHTAERPCGVFCSFLCKELMLKTRPPAAFLPPHRLVCANRGRSRDNGQWDNGNVRYFPAWTFGCFNSAQGSHWRPAGFGKRNRCVSQNWSPGPARQSISTLPGHFTAARAGFAAWIARGRARERP